MAASTLLNTDDVEPRTLLNWKLYATGLVVVLLGLAGAGVASRAAIGFLSPGAYAEEVVAARVSGA